MRVVTLAWAHPTEACDRPRTLGTRYDLLHAHLCAGLRALDHDAQPMIFRQLPRMDTLVADLCRRRPDTIIVHVGQYGDNALASFTRALAARAEPPRIIQEALPLPPVRPSPRAAETCTTTWAELAATLGAPELPAAVAAVSPWTAQTVPPAQAPAIGVLVDDLTAGGAHPRDPQLVVRDLRTLARRIPHGHTVPLVGSTMRLIEGGALLQALREAGELPPLRAEIDASSATAGACRDLRSAGVVELTLQVPVGGDPVVPANVRRALVAAAAHIPRVGVAIEPLPGCAAGAIAAELLAPVVPYLTVRTGPGQAAPQPAGTGSPAARRMSAAVRSRAEARAGQLALARVLSGRYPPSRLGRSATVTDLWWGHRDPPARHGDWLAAVTGPETTLWVTEPEHVDHPVPFLGAVRLARLAPTGPERIRLAGLDVSLPLMPYRAGRDYTGPRPVVLCVEEGDPSWLADADTAWHTGVFAAGFLNPMTILRDANAWLGGRGAGVPPRLVVSPDGAVCTGFQGDAVARLRDDPARAAQLLRDLPAGRDTAIARLTATRPWWEAYLSVRDAVKAICGSHAARAAPHAWLCLRVTGFGEEPGAVRAGGVPARFQVVTLPAGQYVYARRSGRVAAVRPVVATLAEAWLRHGDDAVAQVVVLTRQTPDRVSQALTRVRQMLDGLEKGLSR
jgi:hypothetical protein